MAENGGSGHPANCFLEKNKGYDEDYSGDKERYPVFINRSEGKYGPVCLGARRLYLNLPVEHDSAALGFYAGGYLSRVRKPALVLTMACGRVKVFPTCGLTNTQRRGIPKWMIFIRRIKNQCRLSPSIGAVRLQK